MSYVKQYYASSNNDLMGRSAVAMVDVCRDIISEGWDVDDHEMRLNFANDVMVAPTNYYNYFMWDIIMNPSISANISDEGDASQVPDGDLKYVISTAWNSVAERLGYDKTRTRSNTGAMLS